MIFGVFTDMHYSIKNNDEVRFFQKSLGKMRECITFFEEAHIDFMFCLGDLVDCDENEMQQLMLLHDIQHVLEKVKVPFYLCLGNHDVNGYSYKQIMSEFMPDYLREYYSFDRENVHFVVLDTNYDRNGEHYCSKTMRWDELYVDETQLQWLRNDLEQTEYATVLCTHGNLDYREENGCIDPHVVKNYKEIQSIIDESRKVCLVLQGHDHAGGCNWQNGIPYVTIPALVDGEKPVPLILIKNENGKQLEILLYDVSMDKVVPKERIVIDNLPRGRRNADESGCDNRHNCRRTD